MLPESSSRQATTDFSLGLVNTLMRILGDQSVLCPSISHPRLAVSSSRRASRASGRKQHADTA